ncbi:phenylpropionate dioxygenase-like ring-hydroxylating dioxygenase large terminal subunit [Kitasatospora sp. MAA4]|uniref:aromatic ring-hydroxylating dioxygenase subunit alpha n=1 Tax=Kitasatospora sp. MAA4 TaxID=3035093 RepID=UPI002473E67E|nr:aromatic ring-hydroxylating dioxygenase subunit alpha [Kitasatospora sp. MAA4]MDH6136210.1 phenylpropionate dioxygenase-like ring-hydroxylating dioxygenase large terminal subunit [Kitasatospora sp. MAA4]
MDQAEHQLLRHTWFPVARIEDVADRPVSANILGTRLVVYRIGDSITVAQADCPHRGVDLAMGAVREDGLECPYHGWIFEAGTGRCTLVPSLPPGSSPVRTTLRTYRVAQAYGHVWSCLEEPYLPIAGLADVGRTSWHLAYGKPVDLNCGMRQLTENFRDMGHFPFVHQGSMGPDVRRVVDPYQVHRDGWELEWELSTDLGGTALEGNQALGTRQTLTYHLSLPMFAWIRTVFPDGGRRLVAQFATPITADGLRVRQFWVVGIDDIVIEQHGVSLEEMWKYERVIFEEDYPIVENQYPKEAPLDVRSQAHAPSDRYSVAYRRAYTELLETFAKESR